MTIYSIEAQEAHVAALKDAYCLAVHRHINASDDDAHITWDSLNDAQKAWLDARYLLGQMYTGQPNDIL